MYNTAVMMLWNGFYQIEPSKKESKKVLLDHIDNGERETTMKLTELETFVLHDLSTREVTGVIKDAANCKSTQAPTVSADITALPMSTVGGTTFAEWRRSS